MIVTEKLRNMWKELLMAYNITIQHSAVGKEQNHKNIRISGT
jgi:hypothetical protein